MENVADVDEKTFERCKCGLGVCKLILRLFTYVLAFVAFKSIEYSEADLFIWTAPEVKYGGGYTHQHCWLLSKDALSLGTEVQISSSLNVNAPILQASFGDEQDFCGFSINELVEVLAIRQLLRSNDWDWGAWEEASRCLRTAHCLWYPQEVTADDDAPDGSCAWERSTESCPWYTCHRTDYERALNFTGLLNSAPAYNPAGVPGYRAWLDLTCSEQERHMRSVFGLHNVPKDRLKAAAFGGWIRRTSLENSLGNLVGVVLNVASVIAIVMWMVSVCSFLFDLKAASGVRERVFGDIKPVWLKVFLEKSVPGTVTVATALLPLAILRPLAGVKNMPEPFEGSVLVSTPSHYRTMVDAITVALLVALPCMCCGTCAMSICKRGCLGALAWTFALVVFLPCLIVVAMSYWQDGFFLYVDWSMVFSMDFTWNVALKADLVQLFFAICFLMDLIDLVLRALQVRKLRTAPGKPSQTGDQV